MSEEPVQFIRENARNLTKITRRTLRHDESDVRRDLKISSDSILDIVNKLKTKSSITVSELQILKNALIEDEKNIKLVLTTHGALRGLVREISGQNGDKQCAAANCCCNLALGDVRACSTVAKAAGPYLITLLSNVDFFLTGPCAWAIGNLAGSGTKVCEILIAQGAVSKLIELLTTGDEDIQDAALYALVHFAYQMKDELRSEYVTKILKHISKLDTMTSSQLLFILSCHKDFLTSVHLKEILQKLLQNLPNFIKNHSNCHKAKKCCQLLYSLRILANLDVHMYNDILNYFVINNLSGCFKVILLSNDSVNNSLLWLLGNLYNYNTSHIFFISLLN